MYEIWWFGWHNVYQQKYTKIVFFTWTNKHILSSITKSLRWYLLSARVDIERVCAEDTFIHWIYSGCIEQIAKRMLQPIHSHISLCLFFWSVCCCPWTNRFSVKLFIKKRNGKNGLNFGLHSQPTMHFVLFFWQFAWFGLVSGHKLRLCDCRLNFSFFFSCAHVYSVLLAKLTLRCGDITETTPLTTCQ